LPFGKSDEVETLDLRSEFRASVKKSVFICVMCVMCVETKKQLGGYLGIALAETCRAKKFNLSRGETAGILA